MKIEGAFTARNTVALLLILAFTVGCNIGSYDDAVEQFNAGVVTPPPAPPPVPPPAGLGPNFSEIQTFVFTPSCATSSCHSGANPSASLNLDATNGYAMLVAPNDPGASYLTRKMENTAGITGQQMPLNRPAIQ
jgi:hypothetical protein